MSFANLKIGTRLALGFALMLILLALSVGTGVHSMGRIGASIDQIVDDHNAKVSAASTMVNKFRDIGQIISNIVLLRDAVAIQQEHERLAAARQDYGKAKKALLGVGVNEKEKELLARLDEAIKISAPIVNKVVELGTANKSEEAAALLTQESIPAIRKAIDVIDELVVYETDMAKSAAEEAKGVYADMRNLMVGLGILGVALGVLIAWSIGRSITRPINAAVQVARTVAAGDLTSRIEVTSTDETGQLMESLKVMNDSLARIVSQVRGGTGFIASASTEIASGNQDLSSRTEAQASSLEETASSMEELTSTVKQNADNAQQANQLARSASEVALKGGEVVSKVVDTMDAISGSSRKIVDIIAVIDGIAFQTNILALNAAVEAARAGEQGRGFAVVASEVRNLAQRSAAAAREVKTLIGDSVEKVESGTKLVDEAGATMQEIVDSIRRVTDIMAEITAASREQTSGIEQINQAVTQMDQATQQNSALVEQAAAAAQSLNDQAGKLQDLVAVFKLDQQGQAALPSSTAMPLAQRPAKAALPARVASPARIEHTAAVDKLAIAKTAKGDDWEEF